MSLRIMNKKYILSLVISVSALLSVACSQVQTTERDHPNAYSAVATTDESFSPKANDKFVWYNEVLINHENTEIDHIEGTKRFIEATIEDEVKLKNYTITQDDSIADYMIGAAVILDDSKESQQISNFVKVFPEIGPSINHYKEGTVIVVITKPGDIRKSKILWRGAIQTYILGEELTSEQRQVRVKAFIKQLMSSLPLGN